MNRGHFSSARPAVVAVGYNRSRSLLRLLQSLRSAQYPDNVPLVISLDWSGDAAIADLAEAFDWPHGPKRVIRHERNLGLRRHILSCGDLTSEYGAIALFEDDLLAAPNFYAYLQGAIHAYVKDPRIGGMALYNYKLNEFNNMDFEPIEDGSDVYFLQVAASWGQAWTAGQWADFRQWYEVHQNQPFDVSQGIPRQLAAWRENSWKRYYIKYLAATGRYFVYPRASLSTNLAVPGTNTRRSVSIYQTPLDQRARDWRFESLDSSLARYDVFYEPEAGVLRQLQPALGDEDFDVDLYGAKPVEALRHTRLLSSRPVSSGAARRGPGFALQSGGPPAGSVLAGQAGGFFRLADRQAFGAMTISRRYQLLRATQVGDALNALLFGVLKPIQVEMMIAKRERAERKAAGHGG